MIPDNTTIFEHRSDNCYVKITQIIRREASTFKQSKEIKSLSSISESTRSSTRLHDCN